MNEVMKTCACTTEIRQMLKYVTSYSISCELFRTACSHCLHQDFLTMWLDPRHWNEWFRVWSL